MRATERPILMSAPMVRAILAGTKTQTRRVVKATRGLIDGCQDASTVHAWVPRCPYGEPGDRLWVREAFMHEPADYCWEASVSIPCRPATTVYRADYPESMPGEGWKPSIHMPYALSRITLEITGVRVERLQDISEADALAEGCIGKLAEDAPALDDARAEYRELWERINGPGSWDANPWVWVVEFKRV